VASAESWHSRLDWRDKHKTQHVEQSDEEVRTAVFGEKLQRDEAPKLGILGLVHNAHAATAEFLDNAVV
jgi:hypothetical protein